MGLGQSKELGEGLEGESLLGFPGGGNHQARKAVTGVMQQNWGETQNWNWGSSMLACFLMTVKKKEDRDWRGSAEELAGVGRGGRGKNYQNRVFKNLLSTKEKI